MRAGVRTATVLLLILVPLPLFSQAPRAVPAGCDLGQILGLEHNQTVVFCSALSGQMAGIEKRLRELATENAGQQRALKRFVQQINATSALLKDRDDQLTRSVSEFLRQSAQHTDGKLIEDVTSMTDRLARLETRLDALQRDSATAARARDALAGGVGANLASLKPDQAAEILAGIGLLDKKLDELAVRIDCSAATPDALAVALRAHSAERVLSLVRCRPENAVTSQVQTPYVLLFTSSDFPAAEPFLDALIARGYNPLREIHPLPGPNMDPSNASGPLLARYYFAPVYRPLMDGNLPAVQWIIANAPPGYWSSYPRLMEDMTKIMRLPWSSISGATAAQAIVLLRHAGVSAATNDYKAFREAYQSWLTLQLPNDLRSPMEPPTPMQRMMARQAGYSLTPRAPRPGEQELWKAVSDALAPDSPEILQKARSAAVFELTERELQQASKLIEQANDQLARTKWWRKLPETQANLAEAARRQQANVFDTFGYAPVAAGDLRDDDVARNQFYPNCDCVTVKQLRDRLARASERRESILRFRSAYAK
jgi:hypothetical protein